MCIYAPLINSDEGNKHTVGTGQVKGSVFGLLSFRFCSGEDFLIEILFFTLPDLGKQMVENLLGICGHVSLASEICQLKLVFLRTAAV